MLGRNHLSLAMYFICGISFSEITDIISETLLSLGFFCVKWKEEKHTCYLRGTECGVRARASLRCQVKHSTSNTKEAVG